MSLFVRAYVSETIKDAVEKLRAMDVIVDYTPDPHDASKCGFIKDGGVIYDCDEIRKCQDGPHNFSASVMTGIEIIDDDPRCVPLFKKIYQVLSVVQCTPGYELDSLPND